MNCKQTLNVSHALLNCGEGTRGLDNPVNIEVAPWNVLRVTALSAYDFVVLAISRVDYELVVLALDFTLESAVDGIVTEHVGHIISLRKKREIARPCLPTLRKGSLIRTTFTGKPSWTRRRRARRPIRPKPLIPTLTLSAIFYGKKIVGRLMSLLMS